MYIFVYYGSEYYMRVLRQSFLHLPVGTVCECRTYSKLSINFQIHHLQSCLPLQYEMTLLICTTLVTFVSLSGLLRQVTLPCKRIGHMKASSSLAPLPLSLPAQSFCFPNQRSLLSFMKS